MPVLTTPPVTQPPRLMTAAEFARLPDTRGLELDDGVLVDMRVGADSNLVAGEVYCHIRAFCGQGNAGRAIPPGTAFQCDPDHPDRVRKPDGGFVRAERMPARRARRTFICVRPDLAVEVVSPNDKAGRLERRVREYMRIGVPLLWVIYPETQTARVYRPSNDEQLIPPDGHLDGEEVLPGFRLPLADLFPPEPAAVASVDGPAPAGG